MRDLVRAYRWWCEDEVCDCTQYRIEQIHEEPNPGLPGRTRFRFRLLWEGQFKTDSTDLTRPERAELLRHFRKAARRFGVPLVTSGYGQSGERGATETEKGEMA